MADDDEFIGAFEEEEEEEEPGVSEEDREQFSELISQITERCEAADLQIQVDEGGEFGTNYDIFFPEKRDKRLVTIWDIEDAETILSFSFEKTRYIEDYISFCSYEDRVISAAVAPLTALPSPIRGRASSRRLLRSIIGNPDGSPPDDLKIELKKSENPGAETVTLGNRSRVDVLMSRGTHQARLNLSLKIENVRISGHDEAKRILESISDCLFFQIESETGIPLGIVRPRSSSARPWALAKKRSDPPSYIFPKTEYSHDPMTFYWYAISAHQMPLMQFLAFYQAIEYFLPIYSEYEAKRSIQGVLRSPSFRVDRDTDIARLLQTARSAGGRGFGDELSQLNATLRECIPEPDLRAYLSEIKERGEFFSKSKLVKVHKIPLDAPSADIVKDVAERVYELRCRIVHTKVSHRGEESEPLLPYTTEEHNLHFDIALMKFLAFRVISYSGSALSL